MAAAAMLDFCTMCILALNLTVGPHCQAKFQIPCKCMQKWRSYGRLTFLKMAAAAILNCYFVTVDHPRSLLYGPNIVLKFHVNRIANA